jgi:transcriptional regulator with XRE-family HTH domain
MSEYLLDFEKEKIAKLLREKRLASKLSVNEIVLRLAEAGIIISPKTLYGYERCVGSPKTRTFIALCEIYGIENITSSFRSMVAETVAEYGTSALSEDEHALLKKCRTLDERGRITINTILEHEHTRSVK